MLLNFNKNLFMANVDLFGWSFGSLGFALLALLASAWRRGDRILLAVAAASVGGHSVYWFSGGPDLGPRYWYPALIPLVLLTTRGVEHAERRLGAAGGGHPPGRVAAFVVLASIAALTTVMPWRAVTKYYRYRGIGSEPGRLAKQERFGRALVFLRSDERDYQAAFNFNPPTLDDAAPVFARDLGAARRAAVVRALPDRPVWVIGRNRPGEPLRVIAGPLPPGTVPP